MTEREARFLGRRFLGQDYYHIRVKGHLDACWSEWFQGMSLTAEEEGETVLAGPIVDQAALHGVLAKLRDLGLPLLSVTRSDLDLRCMAAHSPGGGCAREIRQG